MDLHQIRQILDLVREHELSEFEIEHDGLRLKIRKDTNGAHVVTHAAPVPQATIAAPPPASPAPVAGTVPQADDLGEAEIELAVVKSPIVGTFYRSPSPTADSFVRIGSQVEPTTVVCIIEAMKLMNEIQAEATGEVVKIYVENGQAVEYGQPLFGIKSQ